MSLSNLPEMVAAIDSARKRIDALEPKGRGGCNADRRKLIYSLMGSIVAARAKGMSYKDIALAISEGGVVKISQTALKRDVMSYEAEMDVKARDIAVKAAGRS